MYIFSLTIANISLRNWLPIIINPQVPVISCKTFTNNHTNPCVWQVCLCLRCKYCGINFIDADRRHLKYCLFSWNGHWVTSILLVLPVLPPATPDQNSAISKDLHSLASEEPLLEILKKQKRGIQHLIVIQTQQGKCRCFFFNETLAFFYIFHEIDVYFWLPAIRWLHFTRVSLAKCVRRQLCDWVY